VRALCIVLLLGALGNCSRAPEVQFFSADNYPTKLSSWGIIRTQDNAILLAASSHVYDLNTALFTDHALKLRTVHIPTGASATFASYEAFDLPVGSVISKTFFYKINTQGEALLDAEFNGDPASLNLDNIRLIETRLLVKQAAGWNALPYVWKEGKEGQDGDAYLAITGDLLNVAAANTDNLNYLVPSKNQCASCHATNHTSGEILPIGIKARHLNRADPVHGHNQLISWQDRGQLEGLPNLDELTPNALWRDETSADAPAELSHRARSYLDINCGHCHNPQGSADTSALLLDYQTHDPAALGVCKAPIAAGRGSGGYLYSIVPGQPDTSIMTFRMTTNDPGAMMPELGRSLVHAEGLALVSAWIAQMQGECR